LAFKPGTIVFNLFHFSPGNRIKNSKIIQKINVPLSDGESIAFVAICSK